LGAGIAPAELEMLISVPRNRCSDGDRLNQRSDKFRFSMMRLHESTHLYVAPLIFGSQTKFRIVSFA
jgi:hypothetical protein